MCCLRHTRAGDLIFSEATFVVEHEWGLLDSLQPCSPVILQS
jgi:hypothetical protein